MPERLFRDRLKQALSDKGSIKKMHDAGHPRISNIIGMEQCHWGITWCIDQKRLGLVRN